MSYISAQEKMRAHANYIEALTDSEFGEVMEELKTHRYLVEPFCHQFMEHPIGIRLDTTEDGYPRISIASYTYDEDENEVIPIKLTHIFSVKEDYHG